MTYEWDSALRPLVDRLVELELKVARLKPASSVALDDSAGNFGGGFPNLQDILDAIGAGTLPDSFLLKWGGGVGNVQSLGTLGASETIDLANANLFLGTLDADCTITFTGWTNNKDCQIVVILTEDGTGGWTPTFSGVTWDGGGAVPTHDTTAGTFTRYVFTSSDGGTTIIGAKTGSASSASGLLSVTDGVTTVSPATTATVPLGGVADLGGENADLRFLTNRYGAQPITVTDDDVSTSYAIDCSQGNWFDLTLTGNTTFTITNPPPVAGEIFVILRQGGAGSFTVTWPASVDWQDTDGTGGGSAPTLFTAVDALNIISLATVDGGTSWGGANESQAGGGAEALDDLSDVTITSPTLDDDLRFDGSVWVNDARKWEAVTNGEDVFVWESDDLVHEWSAA